MNSTASHLLKEMNLKRKIIKCIHILKWLPVLRMTFQESEKKPLCLFAHVYIKQYLKRCTALILCSPLFFPRRCAYLWIYLISCDFICRDGAECSWDCGGQVKPSVCFGTQVCIQIVFVFCFYRVLLYLLNCFVPLMFYEIHESFDLFGSFEDQ